MKKEKKNKRAMTQLKAYFLIINMIIAIAAFGWMVSAEGDNLWDDLFGSNNIDIIIIDRFGRRARFRKKTKKALAKIILDKALNFTI